MAAPEKPNQRPAGGKYGVSVGKDETYHHVSKNKALDLASPDCCFFGCLILEDVGAFRLGEDEHSTVVRTSHNDAFDRGC